jgi:hypothetical protein
VASNMKFPPKPKSAYILSKAQDKRILRKLNKLVRKKSSKIDFKLLKFLYSQLETDWRTPLEKFVDGLLKKK